MKNNLIRSDLSNLSSVVSNYEGLKNRRVFFYSPSLSYTFDNLGSENCPITGNLVVYSAGREYCRVVTFNEVDYSRKSVSIARSIIGYDVDVTDVIDEKELPLICRDEFDLFLPLAWSYSLRESVLEGVSLFFVMPARVITLLSECKPERMKGPAMSAFLSVLSDSGLADDVSYNLVSSMIESESDWLVKNRTTLLGSRGRKDRKVFLHKTSDVRLDLNNNFNVITKNNFI